MKELINEIKRILKENKITIIIFLALLITLNIELPFYIEKTGGLINLTDRVELDDDFSIEGSLNMTYVSSLKGTIATYITSLFNKNWDIISKEAENGTATESEREFGDKLALQDSIDTAKIVAYQKANSDIKIISQKVYVGYVYEEAQTNLKRGDIFVKINDNVINSKNDINIELDKYNVGDSIDIEVINNNKTYQRTAKLIDIKGKKMIGILCYSDYDLELDPEINLNFKKQETGPSGGLMLALTIYSKLMQEDITKGKKIAGTGVIDENGIVGSIGGVKYKLAGAVKEKVDIFIVPNGDNYKEAMKEKRKNNYKIDIYGVDTFEDALDILKKLD